MNEMITKNCSLHENRVVFICMSKGCDSAFLCRKCYKDHPEDHEPFLKEVYELQENPNWAQTYQQKRDLLVSQVKQVYELKDKTALQCQAYIEQMIDQIAISLEKHKKTLVQELNDIFINADDPEVKNDLFSTLAENMKVLEGYNFNDKDEVEKAIFVKEFERLEPTVEGLITAIQSKVKSCKLKKRKMKQYRDELIGFIESVHTRNFCAGDSFHSLKDNDTLCALTEANERLTQSFEGLHKQIEELKIVNSDLLEKRNNFKNQVVSLTEEYNKLKQQNTYLTQANTHLTQQLSDLAPEKLAEINQALSLDFTLPWRWSSNPAITLSGDFLKATRTSPFGSSWTAIVGNTEISSGCCEWEIEAFCNGSKVGYVLGIIESRMVSELVKGPYGRIIGLAMDGGTSKASLENPLLDYNNKVYLCALDLDAGTFTISHEGTVICKQQGDLRNKVFLPCVCVDSSLSTAKLRFLK